MATDVEREIRGLLAERADDVRPRADVPPRILQRTRRRRFGTAFGSAVVVAGLVAAAVVGTRALIATTAAPQETRLGGPDAGQFAVWPQQTREEAEAAQRCADEMKPECLWQLNALEVVRRYGEQELGWNQVFAFVQGFSNEYVLLPLQGEEQDIGLVDVVDPLTVRIAECLPPQIDLPECRAAQLTVEKLLVPDVTGIWSISEAQHGTYEVPESPPPSPAAGGAGTEDIPGTVIAFVERFMDARHSGSGAEWFLADRAPARYERRVGGLSLYGYAMDGTWEIDGETLHRPGPEEYNVQIRIYVGESTIVEDVLVASMPDGDELGPAWRDFRLVDATMR